MNLSAWRVARWTKPLISGRNYICIAAAALSLVASPAFAAGDAGKATLSLNSISAPTGLLSTIEQALAGPAQDAASNDYNRSAANARAALGDLKPQVSVGLQAVADAPYAKSKFSAAAGPGLAVTLPTGKGATQVTLGTAVRAEDSGKSIGAQASISTRLPIFSGPDTRRPAAEQDLLAAQVAYQTRMRQLIIDAINSYNSATQAEEALVLATQLRKLAELDYNMSQEQYQRGTLSSTELFRARTSLYSAQDSETAAEHAWEESKTALSDLVGTGWPQPANAQKPVTGIPATNAPAASANASTNTLLQVSAPTPSVALDTDTLDQATLEAWINLALERRSDLQLAKQSVRLAEAALEQAQAQAKRDVAFVANATWPKSVSETDVDLRTDISVGIQANYHLFNPRRTEAVVAAEATLARAKVDLDSLERQIRRAIPAAIHRVIEAEQAVNLAHTQLSQEETALAVVQERVAQGLAIAREVAAQELAIAQQTSRLHKLDGQRIVAYVVLWNTAGLDAVELGSPTNRKP